MIFQLSSKTSVLYMLSIYYFFTCLWTFDINALLKLDQDLSADVSKVSCADESLLCNTMSKSQGGDNQGNHRFGLILSVRTCETHGCCKTNQAKDPRDQA